MWVVYVARINAKSPAVKNSRLHLINNEAYVFNILMHYFVGVTTVACGCVENDVASECNNLRF